jgi:ADP-heptose:LPS heptosyltransferase
MSRSKGILIIFPTNIGDAVIALPVLDRVRENYPSVKVTVFASPRTHAFLERNDSIDEVVVFDKHWAIKSKVIFVCGEYKKYDTVIDLKHSLFPFLLGAKHFTPVVRFPRKNVRAVDEYLDLTAGLLPSPASMRSHFKINDAEKKKIDAWGLRAGTIFLACSSRSHLKEYNQAQLGKLVKSLVRKYTVAVMGEELDRQYYSGILDVSGVVDLIGKTGFAEVFYLFENYAAAIVCVDSALMQAASYCGTKIVALFGPTDSLRYGPWSRRNIVLRNSALECAPCAMAVCKNNYECMNVDAGNVSAALEGILNEKS